MSFAERSFEVSGAVELTMSWMSASLAVLGSARVDVGTRKSGMSWGLKRILDGWVYFGRGWFLA
jgi:hypothetical protein